jgi:hypothetical protein
VPWKPSRVERMESSHIVETILECKRYRESRRSFATTELPKDKVKVIRSSRMDPRHAHLDKMLDPK